MNIITSIRFGIRAIILKSAILLGIWSPRPFVAVLAIGQSNMEGRFGPVDPAFTDVDERINVWSLAACRWIPAHLGKEPFYQAKGSRGPANNLAYVFSQTLAEDRGAIIRLVLLARGGVPIETFLPGGDMAPDLLAPRGHAAQALRSLGKSAYDVLLVHQGEANFTDPDFEPAETYADKLRDLLARLTDAGLVNRKTKIVMGEISAGYRGSVEHAKALRMLSDHCAIARWSGVETVGLRDGTGNQHATGNGLQLLGERYFRAYERLITQPVWSGKIRR